jgi:hypothetical protein
MTIRDVIKHHGRLAHGGDPDAAAKGWEETGPDATEMAEWLDARHFYAGAAKDWRMPDPEWRRARTHRSEAYLDTLAFTVAAGDLGGLTKRSSWPACGHA